VKEAAETQDRLPPLQQLRITLLEETWEGWGWVGGQKYRPNFSSVLWKSQELVKKSQKNDAFFKKFENLMFGVSLQAS
jgi:hypothetical protein